MFIMSFCLSNRRSAYRCTNPEPTRLLVTLGASLTMQDSIHKNTPFHWACLAKNYHVIAYLVNKTAVNYHITNTNREIPQEIVQKYIDLQKKDSKMTFALPLRIVKKIEAATNQNRRRNIFVSLKNNPQVKLALMYATPFMVFWLVGDICALSVDWLVKLGLLALIYIALSLLGNFVFDERILMVMPIAIYFTTKFW